MKEKFKMIALGLLLATVVSSCNENESTTTESNMQDQEKGVAIKLGKKLENPYSVKNMRKALDNLRKSKQGTKIAAADIEISTTHLYLKFSPKNEGELDQLKLDSTLVFYTYPLDYEIAVNGDFYRDPLVPQDQPTPLYCAVKVDDPIAQSNQRVNGNKKATENATVEKAVLEELFIPDEEFDTETDGSTSKKANSTMRKINGKMVSVELIDALVEEALRITNNADKTDSQNKTSKTTSRSWRPSGRIQVWDDSFNGYVGVAGAQVRARRWFTTHRGWVGADGYYSCDGTFKHDANYSIDWDRHDFAIQDGWLNGATYNGPKKKWEWNLELRGDKQEYYAHIYRAANHYYYEDILGLRRPPQNKPFRTQMKIRAIPHNNGGGAAGTHLEERRFLGAQVKIFTYAKSAEDTYSTVIHELAHASHWDMNKDNFDASESRIKESWAVGVEWVLTRLVYPDYNRGFNSKYTGVVVDMIDGIAFDNVTGYSIREIEDALNGQTSWTGWRDNIKNTYDNATENQLDILFNNWNL